ncbi:extracellular solute-binding protein [Ruminococcaceae bacterium OttesenSCG-928-L11]|nr:extracellular solute-binding protein [Ruminococcaceae bacterium OttesenSCG-928-L11]
MARYSRARQLVSILLAVLMVAGCLAGCGQGGTSQTGTPSSTAPSTGSTAGAASPSSAAPELTGSAANVNPPGEFPICKEPITIRVGIPQNANVENYETNKVTLWYQEKGNFTLEFDLFPTKGSEAQQKLEIMIASGGELPEALIGFGGTISEEAVLSYGLEGAVLPLNDYIDTWGYYIHEALGNLSNKEMLSWMTSADGNIYYIPKSNEQLGNMYSLRTWINTQWLDNLGLDMPSTTDEFKDVMLKFLSDDPNGNGQKDEVGLIGNPAGWRSHAADFLMNAFIYNDTQNRFIVQDGKLVPAYTQPEWREGLRYLNDLVKNGILMPQSFTMDNDQIKQMTEGGDVATVSAFTAGGYAVGFGATNERKYEYAALPPLTGPGGASYASFFPDIPQKHFLISKDAQNPEAIFRWADLMCSIEGIMRQRWGEPGVDWLEPGPNDKGSLDAIGFEAKIVPILPWGSVNNSHWSWPCAGMLPVGYADGQVPPADDPLYAERWIAAAVPLYMDKEADETADLFKFTLDEADEIKDMKATINTYVKESMALFAVGDRDIEKDWDSYLKELDAMGLDRYVELSQAGYERAKG